MNFQIEPYSYVVSLGYNCGAAYQIRLHKMVGEANFFDWLYTDVEGAENLIRNDFAGFMNQKNWEIIRDGTEILDKENRIRLNHSFKKPGERQIDMNLMRENYQLESDKFEYLANKFRNMLLVPERIALIRYNPYPGRADSVDKILSLASALSERRSQRPFTLFWVTNSETPAPARDISDNVRHLTIVENKMRSTSLNGKDFIGTDDLAWQEIFEEIPVKLAGRRRPKEEPIFNGEI